MTRATSGFQTWSLQLRFVSLQDRYLAIFGQPREVERSTIDISMDIVPEHKWCTSAFHSAYKHVRPLFCLSLVAVGFRVGVMFDDYKALNPMERLDLAL